MPEDEQPQPLSASFREMARVNQAIADHPSLQGLPANVSLELGEFLRALVIEAVQPIRADIELLRGDVRRIETNQQRFETTQITESVWTTIRIQNAEAKGHDDPLYPLPTIAPGGNGVDGPYGPAPEDFPLSKGRIHNMTSATLSTLLRAYGQAVPPGRDARRAAFCRFIGAKA